MLNPVEQENYQAHVKMPTFVGILTFISIFNTFESLEASKDFIFQHLSFYEQLKFHAQSS